MQELTTLLKSATGSIAYEYYSLPVDSAASVYRERVYCYELYHQMRTRWPHKTAWRINGEVDKRLHPYFDDTDTLVPDLLIHQPGTRRNHAVIEVKRSSLRADGIEKDLSALTTLSCRFGYERPIYLIFGPNSEQASVRIMDAIKARGETACIEVWLHLTVGTPAEMVWQHEGVWPSFRG